MNRDFSRQREREDEKLDLAKATAAAMQAALAGAERREAAANAEAAKNNGNTTFFKWVAGVGLVLALVTGVIGSWEPVAKWVSPRAMPSK